MASLLRYADPQSVAVRGSVADKPRLPLNTRAIWDVRFFTKAFDASLLLAGS